MAIGVKTPCTFCHVSTSRRSSSVTHIVHKKELHGRTFPDRRRLAFLEIEQYAMMKQIMREIIVNKRAKFDYEILETYEAGLELYGFEVKAIRLGHMSLIGAFAVIQDNQAWLLNAHISTYQPKNIRIEIEYEPTRTRRLLLHKSEIKELIGKSAQKGLTMVPLRVYNKKRRIKILIGLGRSKKKTDKRETIKKRETERDIERELKN